MKYKIAVVDDNDVYNKLITKSLEHEGFEVYSYTDSNNALEEILERDFNLVICDWMMPNVDGITLLNKVKAVKQTPFWFLSAAKDNAFIQKAYNSGAHKISFKDDNKNELIVDITNFFLEKSKDCQDGYITTYLPSHTFKEYSLIMSAQNIEIICAEEIPVGTIISVTHDDETLMLKVENLERLENNNNSHICIKI